MVSQLWWGCCCCCCFLFCSSMTPEPCTEYASVCCSQNWTREVHLKIKYRYTSNKHLRICSCLTFGEKVFITSIQYEQYIRKGNLLVKKKGHGCEVGGGGSLICFHLRTISSEYLHLFHFSRFFLSLQISSCFLSVCMCMRAESEVQAMQNCQLAKKSSAYCIHTHTIVPDFCKW